MKGLIGLFAGLIFASSARAEALPDAAALLKRIQARMEEVCNEPPANRFQYTRTNVIDELDSGGKLKKRQVKTYEVALAHGLPRAKLVAIDGRQLPESEQRWRGSEEMRLQRTLTQDKGPDYSKPKPWLTDDILERFEFQVTGRTNHLGRPALIVEFSPKKGAATKSMADRIVNKISGALWVDESEAEIARLDLKMSEPVKFWGGILGQLDRFEFTVWRARSEFGAWFNEKSDGLVQIRKLLATTRFKIREDASDFKKAGAS